MSTDVDHSAALARTVGHAHATRTALFIHGGGSKAFLGAPCTGQTLDVTDHRGVVSYQPGELVITARAGTPLAEIEDILAERDQMLPFEPPHHGASATLGGTIASGLSGPARPYFGAARDFVLGARIINGRGEILRFGGEVMKNVAGYDLSRLMVGAFGTLGVLLEISLKVLPTPRTQMTRVFEHNAATAIARFNHWGRKPWPITGAYWEAGHSYLRLAGAQAAVTAAAQQLGGEALIDDASFWQAVRELKRPLLADAEPLWRLSVAPSTPDLGLAGDQAIDWGGAQRWLASTNDPSLIRQSVTRHGGHASLYRGQGSARFHPLSEPLLALHRRIKQSLDPAGILNAGRLYPDL